MSINVNDEVSIDEKNIGKILISEKYPFGLIKVTFPLEFNLPDIVDGVDPLTLFRDDELDDGILKSTLPPE